MAFNIALDSKQFIHCRKSDLIGGAGPQRGERFTAWKGRSYSQACYVWLDGHHTSHSFLVTR